MTAVKFLVLGGAAVAGLAAAAPAAAQYPGYGGSPYGYSPNVIGQVLQSILNPYGQFGYNRGVNPQIAVNQCTAAVQQRLARQYGGGYGYNPYGNAYGGQYGSPYGNAYGGQYGSPYGGQYGSPYGGQYGNPYGGPQVLGITRVEQRSASTLRVRGVASSGRVHAYGQPYGGYAQPYGYGGGYGAPYGGYVQAQAPADLIFRCDVDYRGYVRDIDIDRRD